MLESTALVRRSRPLRLVLDDPGVRPLWLGRLLESIADWLVLLAVLVTVWRVTADVGSVALVFLARSLPRLVVTLAGARALEPYAAGLLLPSVFARVLLTAGFVFVAGGAEAPVLIVLMAAYSTLAAISGEGRSVLLIRILRRSRLSGAVAANALAERAAFLVGPLVGAFVLAATDARTTFSLAALLLAIATFALVRAWRAVPGTALAPLPAAADIRFDPRLILLAASTFATGALATVVAIRLVPTVGPEGSVRLLGIYLAIVGLGVVLGPLPVNRLLGRVPIAVLVAGTVVLMALGVLVVGQTVAAPAGLLILLAFGLLGVTHDAIATIAVRRLATMDAVAGGSRALVMAGSAGGALAAILIVATVQTWSVDTQLIVVAVVSVLVVAVAFILTERPALL